jgi:Flp pilus assembly protein CpaB
VSRRGRAVAFLLAAAFAAAGAAAIADGYGRSVAGGYGELRPVVVAVDDLAAKKPIDPSLAARGLETRRIPARFVPPGSLSDPGQALGLAPLIAIPAGAYLLASELRPPRAEDSSRTPLGDGRRPVELAVSGADALLVDGGEPVGSRVDVVVTTEPTGSAGGHTYVAATGALLLALGPGAEGAASGGATVTLGLTRPQALRLIAAESFARQITVLPSR